MFTTQQLAEMSMLFFLVAITPGPSMLLGFVVATAKGPGRAMIAGAGLLCGLCLFAALSMLGLGVLLLALPGLMGALKIAGIAYLTWLGLKAIWRAWMSHTGSISAVPVGDDDTATLFKRGFLVALTNPKAILFFAGVFPQFIPADGLLQAKALTAILVFAVAWSSAFAVYATAGGLLQSARLGTRSVVSSNLLTGSIFLGAAALLATRR